MPFYNLGLEGYVGYALYAAGILAFLLSIFWRPQIGIYYLTPLIPLQTVRYRLNAFPLGESVVYVMLAGVALGLLRQRRWVLPRTPWTRLLLIYMAFTFLSMCAGSWFLGVGMPWETSDRRLSDWAAYMTMPALLFLVRAAITDLRQMKFVVLLMCLAGLTLSRSYWSSVKDRDYSTYSEDLHQEGGAMGYAGSNGLAAFEAQFATFLLAMAACERSRKIRLGYFLLAGFAALCLMYALSRAGYAAFLVGWLFLGVVKNRKLLLILVLFALVWTAVVPPAVQERVQMTYDPNRGELDPSAATRVDLWEDAMELVRTHPVFGIGFNTYAYLNRIRNYADTHNIYVKVLVETGAVGLLLFLWLLAKSFRGGWRLFRSAEDPFLRGLGLGLAGWVIAAAAANFFGDRWTFLQIQGLFWVMAGLVARGLDLEEETAPAEEVSEQQDETEVAKAAQPAALPA